jgi:iron(III) transport system ATP-binding protein
MLIDTPGRLGSRSSPSAAETAEFRQDVRAMSSISLTDLSKAFGHVRAVDGLSLEADQGTLLALLGPSGCGKTTLLRLIAGFERPDGGRVSIGGRTLAAANTFVPPERRRVGVVFQDYALFPHLDVAANIGYGLGRDGAGRVAEVLALVGLDGLEDRAVHDLSGGQQQRVALARALAPTPELILLDEPFSNLDAGMRESLRHEVREIILAAGITAIFVTHDQEEALSIAHQVAVMREGRIEQVGTPEEIYGQPASRWVAEFLGEAEILSGTVSEGFVECELGRIGVDPGFRGAADVILRPESVAIGAGPAPRGGDTITGVVVERTFYGHDQLVRIELDSGCSVRSRRLGFPAWHPGDHVKVWIEGPVNVLPARPSA